MVGTQCENVTPFEHAHPGERQQNDLPVTEADSFRQARGTGRVKQRRDRILVKVREITVRRRARGHGLVLRADPVGARGRVNFILHEHDRFQVMQLRAQSRQ